MAIGSMLFDNFVPYVNHLMSEQNSSFVITIMHNFIIIMANEGWTLVHGITSCHFLSLNVYTTFVAADIFPR